MTKIEKKYEELCNIPSDISNHLPLIRKYVSEGDSVLEMGVRYCVSTWALLANKPRLMRSIDVVSPPAENLKEVEDAAKEAGIDYQFIQADSLQVGFESADVLFIDTLHFYSHLVKELWAHSPFTRKYIILHDSRMPEMWACITDFLYNRQWELVEQDTRDTGLCVLKRIC